MTTHIFWCFTSYKSHSTESVISASGNLQVVIKSILRMRKLRLRVARWFAGV